MKNLSDVYFQGIADDMANAKQISSIYTNMSDVGDIRENILLRFLQSHIPLRSEIVKGGMIFDSIGNCSKQIDLIVVSDSALKFSYFDRDASNSKCMQTVEGTLAAISVKSNLKTDTLDEALKNLSSIPQMPSEVIKNIFARNKHEYYRFPYKIIFSYESTMTPESIMEKIISFNQEMNLKTHQMVDLVVVNNKCYVEKNVLSTPGVEGKITYEFKEPPEETKKGTSPLFKLLLAIHAGTTWSPHVTFDYSNYHEAMNLY